MQKEEWKSYTGKGREKGVRESPVQHPPPRHPSEVLWQEHKPHTLTSIPVDSFPQGGRSPRGGTAQREQGRPRSAPRSGIPPGSTSHPSPQGAAPPPAPSPAPASRGRQHPKFTFPEAARAAARPRGRQQASQGVPHPRRNTPRDGDAGATPGRGGNAPLPPTLGHGQAPPGPPLAP